MRLTNELVLEQQQKLIMTPELRLAIAILQMSTLELSEYAQNELEENPLLEEIEVEETREENTEPENENLDKTAEWLEYFNDRDIGFPINDITEKSFDNFLTQRPSLYEHLQFQLHLTCKDNEEMKVGQYIIGNIDSHGYLCVETEEITAQTGADIQQVQRVISLVQSFHPHGVGAYNLGECLLIQLRYFGKEDDMVRLVIEKHLDDLAKGKLAKIAQALGITIYQVQKICDLIRTLDPKPGLQYSAMDEIKYIIPDIIVEKVAGEYIVVLNDSASPRLMVNQLYENMLRQPGTFSSEACKYLEEKMGAAVWLIRSIEQRRRTLYKVARCIVDFQTDFLNNGIKHLKPLSLKQVADIIDVHESTVSRATAKKYIQTSQGLFEMKYFFGSGVVNQTNHETISSKSIKSIIEDIIDKEDSSRPVSDQTIVEILKIRGINISRRTVAKYRQEMGILPTVSRKRYQY